MVFRKYLILMALLAAFCVANAQQITFTRADSTSSALYQSGNWTALLDFGNRALLDGADFPALRQRMAFAQFNLGNFSAALTQYAEVLKSDSFNQTARYYSYLSQKYLNRSVASSYQVSFLDTSAQRKEPITPFGLVETGLESGLKNTNYVTRGNTFYTRASLSNRLGWRVQLDQSLVYFYQTLTVPATTGADKDKVSNIGVTDTQLEYYAKVTASLNSQFLLLGAYHYLNTAYNTTTYNSHVGLIGLRYINPYFDLQADADFGRIIDKTSSQFNGVFNFYPMGNLNFYTISRASVQQKDGASQTIFSQSAGFKVCRSLWLEGNATFGKLDNYLDAEALYVYNGIDITNFKTGATGFYTLSPHALLYLNYTFERKLETNQNTGYIQNSITGGITWKF